MLSAIPSEEEWHSILILSKKQALEGIVFKGCEKLPPEQRPSNILFLKWLGIANRVKQKNRLLLEKCTEITETLENKGIHCLVLKGQSNRAYYGEELCAYRTSGDIDLWTWTDEGGIARIVEFTNQHRLDYGLPVLPWHRILYYHVESRTAHGPLIELHYRPSYLNCLWRNARLQRWFDLERDKANNARLMSCKKGPIALPIPSDYFNAVYLLLHIYKHLFEEGIGLRQILDYYFMLISLRNGTKEGSWGSRGLKHTTGVEPNIKEDIMHTLFRFGMKKFTGAMMYVLQTVFAMSGEYMLCSPDVKEGRFLLSEIIKAGNFGKYDSRFSHKGGKLTHAWEKLKHNFRLVGHYPEEVLWEPVFRIFHWIWRRFELWKLE